MDFMDFMAINTLLNSNFCLSFVAGYVADKAVDSVMEYAKKKLRPETIEYQLMEALNDAMRNTFEEYDSRAIDKFVASLVNNEQLKSSCGLEKILEDATGQPVSDELLNRWITNIKKEITKPDRQWLYNYYTYSKHIKDDTLKTANKMYAEIFEEVMFLHKDKENKIRLHDLYIHHKCEIIDHGYVQTPYPIDILDCLELFITKRHYISDCLFIEADAGLGKSGMVSYLAYMYENCLESWVAKFGGRELICIRLRDIIPDTMQFMQNSLNVDILHYLNYRTIQSIGDFNSRHKGAVVCLDGFDELCMVEKIHSNVNFYIYELVKLFRDCRPIITTRPQYLRIHELNISKIHIILKHFNKEQRKEWASNYRQAVPDQDNENVLEYIESLEDEETNGICDTPMALYMLAAGQITKDAIQNHWELYNQIFHKELSETAYNRVFPSKSGTYGHPIQRYSDLLHRLSAEIAYEMYKSGNTKLYLTEDEISKIVDGMEDFSDSSIKEIVRHCYALCSYWKKNTEKGAVEFYHNNIRDFFMCEKIFYEMESLYEQCKRWQIQTVPKDIIAKLYLLFSHSEINENVIKFLYLRVLFQKSKKERKNFAKDEQEKNLLPDFFSLMAQGSIGIPKNIMLFSEMYKRALNVIINTIQIYRHAYEPYIVTEDKKITWFNQAYATDSSSFGSIELFLHNVFKQVFIRPPLIVDDSIIYTAGKANFSSIDFANADLRFAGFASSVIRNASFENTILTNADFEGADLTHTCFVTADLRHTNFKNCILIDCDFTDAYLAHTILPDGYTSNDSKKVAKHLRGMNIQGLKV